MQPVAETAQKRQVRVVPIGTTDTRLMDWLEGRLALIFHRPTRRHPQGLDPDSCYDTRRGQYDSRCLLDRLASLAPEDLVLGFASLDLFMPVLTFVIGEAILDGNAAVISSYRLREECYGLPPNPELLKARLEKEAVHELGHCLGLVHCHDTRCVMQASARVEQVDLKEREFCARCRRALEERSGRP